jgi:hypothetical protein
MAKKFKTIKGFKHYEISLTGQVRNISTKLILKPRIHPIYKTLMITLPDKKHHPRTCYIHRLVAKTFLRNKKKKPTVMHLDGNTNNNNVSNLKWASYSELLKHQVKIGQRKQLGNPELYKFSPFVKKSKEKLSKTTELKPASKKSKNNLPKADSKAPVKTTEMVVKNSTKAATDNKLKKSKSLKLKPEIALPAKAIRKTKVPKPESKPVILSKAKASMKTAKKKIIK